PVRWRRVLPWIGLIPVGVLLQLAAWSMPGAVERVYSTTLYPVIALSLTLFTGWFAFSLAEMALIAILIWGTIEIARRAFWLVTRRRSVRNLLLHAVLTSAAVAGFVYVGLLAVWGLNNHRITFADSSSLDSSPASIDELRTVCVALIDRANALREQVGEDDRGVMVLHGGRSKTLERAALGFRGLGRVYPVLDERLGGRPKEVRVSAVMSYLGVSGIHAPFTAEPNVNMDIPDSELPLTASHEMAHHMGFAREDEANFIGYLACRNHPDVDFRYSGVLGATQYCLAAVSRADREAVDDLYETLADGVKRDWKSESDFWSRYETPVREVSSRVNDAYLKSQGQTAGVQSYGRMVDLLIAEHRRQEREP
ncbi:MAG: DUF3810 domain-containing protein, partial [Acidobacteriota bacterium]|nr:DUF3810 domain-containing protein [Acidobacteriota bacterium]